MFGAVIAPAALFGMLVMPIPESPRWLIERKRAFTDIGARDAFVPFEAAGFSRYLTRPVRPKTLLAQLDAPDAPLPPALLEQIRTTVARVDAETSDPYARQAMVNAAAGIYWEAGLNDDANRLLVAELEKSKSPYYFMLDLADLAEKAGRKQEAVDWLARAYAGAKGPATRFQWGYNYLVGMLEMTPEDVQGIERAGLAVLGELDGSPDAFYQRTRMRLEQLDAKLLEWGQTGAAAKVIDTLRARTSEICRKLPEQDAGRANCEKFLAAKARPTQAA